MYQRSFDTAVHIHTGGMWNVHGRESGTTEQSAQHQRKRDLCCECSVDNEGGQICCSFRSLGVVVTTHMVPDARQVDNSPAILRAKTCSYRPHAFEQRMMRNQGTRLTEQTLVEGQAAATAVSLDRLHILPALQGKRECVLGASKCL